MTIVIAVGLIGVLVYGLWLLAKTYRCIICGKWLKYSTPGYLYTSWCDYCADRQCAVCLDNASNHVWQGKKLRCLYDTTEFKLLVWPRNQ